MRHVRLQTRFMVYFSALVVAIMTPVVLLVESRMGGAIARQAEQRGLSIARNLAALCQASLVAYNYVALAQTAETARRDDPEITDVVILDKEGLVAAYSGHPERQGSRLTDPLSERITASRTELLVPTEIPREDRPGIVDRGLDVSIPVFISGSDEKWGTVRVRLSTEEMHGRIAETRLSLLLLGLLAVALGAAGSFVMARRITGPLGKLVEGTIRAARGDLDASIEIRTGDEIEDLAATFNDMVRQVRTNQGAVEELNRSLEEKVRARTQDLSRSNAALMKAYAELQQAEAQVILTEKMASLGQVVAGVAHEINTPSSAIAAALSNMKGYLDSLAVEIPALLSTGLPEAAREPFFGLVTTALAPDPRRGQPSTAEVRERSRVLEAALTGRGPRRPRETAVTFSRLGLHSEIASLLSAPDAQLLPQAALDFLDTVGNLGLAVNDTNLSVDAITRMVKALRSYSHPDRTEMAEADLHDGLETTLTILRSQMKYGVVVERRYSRLPPVLCNVNELNQVWTNLIHNAVQAMRGVGKILIETAESNGSVAVRITDTGPGIPDSLRSRVFDPFFTTKDQGEGTGLGLGIAQQIVRRHGGSITFESQPGRTTFEVLLPLRHPARESAS